LDAGSDHCWASQQWHPGGVFCYHEKYEMTRIVVLLDAGSDHFLASQQWHTATSSGMAQVCFNYHEKHEMTRKNIVE
ncbi:hypothetical protein, partial [uncultured Gimesia sp.]|uniref:hypothetical protein n=1 Tax=uncultured Gimesia sp. TaxID=1678688 RepID=UPI0030D6EA80